MLYYISSPELDKQKQNYIHIIKLTTKRWGKGKGEKENQILWQQ